MNTDLEIAAEASLKTISQRVIGCAYEVGNVLGCGFLEAVYESSLVVELKKQGIEVERQRLFDVHYKGEKVGRYVADLIIARRLIVEIKALSHLTSQHQAQLLNYLKATGMTVGLLLNFGKSRVEVKRLIRD
jgi:GxxExxY protein